MGSRRWLRGQSDVMVSLSTPGPLTTLGTSRSTGAFEEVRRVYEDFATALGRVPHRIGDKRVLGWVTAFLKAGVLSEDRLLRETIRGTPQRGLLPPRLANLALS